MIVLRIEFVCFDGSINFDRELKRMERLLLAQHSQNMFLAKAAWHIGVVWTLQLVENFDHIIQQHAA
ncbi:hypothetical protein D3C86_2183140 [compost metagenome]